MIVGQRKPIQEIIGMLKGIKKILILGCSGCVSVCSAGGEKEVEILALILRIDRKKKGEPVETMEKTLARQCDTEYLEELKGEAGNYDAILSMACGVGVNYLADMYPTTLVFPALNTSFMGVSEEQGVWSERCAGCGDCVLDRTGGLCPIARCSKRLFNGPCGGSQNGKCEIDPNVACVWQLIYDRLKGLNQLEKLKEIFPIKDWSSSLHGGPRKIVREDLKL
ncbi:MAG: methylenetetrahydrofolate reductase C-terminal domain-containing protein [Desulfobacteraceae bacterium]|uniref:Methylenetetrahydrofolate reductase C-terminal domain-containing protein n=1 Tax=Candidatus Desulfaltia bathyphila TaxID=2841697 RepID=A0A8J6N2K1_9BACT|nr:methylenetetrahydrofolate reductase C-terminal domain-containing protein [Candidatus Desulfaltia bathyphila]MBL7194695.1 methylenetetrahydrofolate reductase C-terminal domain-containing protein [Desulfobacterales bacterium]